MDKRKTALTIGKLFGTAIALSIMLIVVVMIEGLEALLKLMVKLINQPVPREIKAIGPALEIAEIPVEIKAIAAALEITGTVIQFPVRLPVNPNLWMISELPRDYLNVKSLKGWAKDREIKGYGKMVKAELIKVLAR